MEGDESHSHDETQCHSVAQMRGQKVQALRQLIDYFAVDQLQEKEEEEQERQRKVKCGLSLMDVPEYLYRASLPPRMPQVPLITSMPCLTIRKTTDKEALKDTCATLKFEIVPVDNPHYKPPWTDPDRKSVELRGSRTYEGCDCVKFNGLQDRCQRMDCQGRPECMTKPYPTCKPSYAYPGPRLHWPVDKPTDDGTQTEAPCCPCRQDKDQAKKRDNCQCLCHEKEETVVCVVTAASA